MHPWRQCIVPLLLLIDKVGSFDIDLTGFANYLSALFVPDFSDCSLTDCSR